MEGGTMTSIIAYVAIACVILIAIYFQFKFIGVDSRARNAETVATKFNNVLQEVKTSDELVNRYKSSQEKLSEIQERNDDLDREIDKLIDENHDLKEELRSLSSAHNALINHLKGLSIEGLTIDDSMMVAERKVFKSARPQSTYSPMYDQDFSSRGRRDFREKDLDRDEDEYRHGRRDERDVREERGGRGRREPYHDRRGLERDDRDINRERRGMDRDERREVRGREGRDYNDRRGESRPYRERTSRRTEDEFDYMP